MMPVGMKKSWNTASPTAKLVGGWYRLASTRNTTPAMPLPSARPTPLTRLPALYTVPRCSGGLTSTMSANQFGELAEVSASASSATTKLTATVGSVSTLLSTARTTLAPSGMSMCSGAKNSTMYSGIPLYIVLFFAPLHIEIPEGANVVLAVLSSVLTEPTVAVSFVVALLALALTSANSPNWFALIVDVNPPEHRGTVYSAGNLVNGVGRALGNGMAGVVFRVLASRYQPPTNFAVGLAVFQLFFIPTGIMYYLASRTTPGDIATVRTMLRDRAAADLLEPAEREATPAGPQ